jgi:hypothetical protein
MERQSEINKEAKISFTSFTVAQIVNIQWLWVNHGRFHQAS